MNNKSLELKKNYRIRYSNVREILNNEDPIGLQAAGCPKDEYDPEISSILPKIDSCNTVEEMQEMIHKEFVSLFDDSTAGPVERYKKIAEQIFKLRVKN